MVGDLRPRRVRGLDVRQTGHLLECRRSRRAGRGWRERTALHDGRSPGAGADDPACRDGSGVVGDIGGERAGPTGAIGHGGALSAALLS